MSDQDTVQVVEEIEIEDYITEVMVSKVFEYLDTVAVHLEEDPTVLGPGYIHERLKECRDYSIEVERLLVRFYDVERKVKNRLAGLSEAYKAERSELMALDTWVSKGKSTADREARADVRLKKTTEALRDLKEQLVNVQYVIKAVELKKEGLNRTNNDVKKQVSLMELSRNNNGDVGGQDYDDLLEDEITGGRPKPRRTPLDDDGDLMGLFGPEDSQVPDDIHPSVAKHIEENPSSPVEDFTMGEEEDPNTFLEDIFVGTTTQAVAAVSALSSPVDEDNIVDDLFADFKPEDDIAPTMEPTDVDESWESMGEDELSDLFADFEPVDTKSTPAPAATTEEVDMESFLAELD